MRYGTGRICSLGVELVLWFQTRTRRPAWQDIVTRFNISRAAAYRWRHAYETRMTEHADWSWKEEVGPRVQTEISTDDARGERLPVSYSGITGSRARPKRLCEAPGIAPNVPFDSGQLA